jgi:hypothetical protein
LGRAESIDLSHDPVLLKRLVNPGYGAKVERFWRISIEAFDWNCPQHITPRYTVDECRTLALV